jgi:hypothetical protein
VRIEGREGGVRGEAGKKRGQNIGGGEVNLSSRDREVGHQNK